MFLDPAAYPLTRVLEGAWSNLAHEASAVPYDHYESLAGEKVARGAWGCYGILHMRDPQCMARWQPHAAACPITCALLRGICWLQIGAFLAMAPGTLLRRHRDMHEPRYVTFLLPLQADRASWMRVGDELRVLEPGRCLVFDPRIDHEAGNDGDRYRTMLFVSVSHSLAGFEAIEPTA